MDELSFNHGGARGTLSFVLLNEQKRAETCVEMQCIVRDDGVTVIIMFAQMITPDSKKFKFKSYATNIILDGGRLVAHWWFTQQAMGSGR